MPALPSGEGTKGTVFVPFPEALFNFPNLAILPFFPLQTRRGFLCVLCSFFFFLFPTPSYSAEQPDPLLHERAKQGKADAQYNLGFAYHWGDGVPEDYIQAYAWCNIAAANGDEGSKKKKTALAELMTKEQIALAEKLSREMVEANPKLIN